LSTSLKISCKSVWKYLSRAANRQQTNNYENVSSLAEVTNTWHNYSYSTKSVQRRLYYYTCLDMFVRWWFSVIKWLVTTVCTRWLPLSASCCCLSNSWQQWQNHNNHDVYFWKVRKTLLLRPWLWCKDLSACISKKTHPNFTKFSVHATLWLWLGPLLMTMQYAMYYQSCGRLCLLANLSPLAAVNSLIHHGQEEALCIVCLHSTHNGEVHLLPGGVIRQSWYPQLPLLKMQPQNGLINKRDKN